MFPKDVPEVPDVPLVPTVMNIVWQNPHQIAKQYCTGDPDPPVEYSLTKL
jgi:hypothetical protein